MHAYLDKVRPINMAGAEDLRRRQSRYRQTSLVSCNFFVSQKHLLVILEETWRELNT